MRIHIACVFSERGNLGSLHHLNSLIGREESVTGVNFGTRVQRDISCLDDHLGFGPI